MAKELVQDGWTPYESDQESDGGATTIARPDCPTINLRDPRHAAAALIHGVGGDLPASAPAGETQPGREDAGHKRCGDLIGR
ncbi:hypothetical protein GCM10010214_53360 [Streptomyces abikoensis]|nr:hypothetical protein GCM10010214_53360 [Streptomyces abikoensis]